ncbi:MAG: SRPBCC domain-containing protein [Acidobacteria bacterium]|nr:SRPBCC domain-containing protein [Acidobacteriota bacterium]
MSNPAEESKAAEATRTVVMERVFAHPPEKVWRALTESKLLAQWLMNNDFEPETGRAFQFRAEPMPQWNGVIDCKVLVMEPLKWLSYSWVSMGLESVVVFTLTPAEGGTQLRMEQSGFRADQEHAYKGASYGWQKFFDGLEHLLDGGAR